MSGVLMCPLCHKAESIVRTEHSDVGEGTVTAASVTLGMNTCGRCGESIARAARLAAQLHVSALRRKAGK